MATVRPGWSEDGLALRHVTMSQCDMRHRDCLAALYLFYLKKILILQLCHIGLENNHLFCIFFSKGAKKGDF